MRRTARPQQGGHSDAKSPGFTVWREAVSKHSSSQAAFPREQIKGARILKGAGVCGNVTVPPTARQEQAAQLTVRARAPVARLRPDSLSVPLGGGSATAAEDATAVYALRKRQSTNAGSSSTGAGGAASPAGSASTSPPGASLASALGSISSGRLTSARGWVSPPPAAASVQPTRDGLPAGCHGADDEFELWPFEDALCSPTDGWETSPGPRRKRGAPKGASADADTPVTDARAVDGIKRGGGAAVHLKHVSADGGSLATTVRSYAESMLSDEDHSDETQLLNEEDWSRTSDGSGEEAALASRDGARDASTTATGGATPKKRIGNCNVASKRLGESHKGGGYGHAASDGRQSRPRGGIKELNDAPPLEHCRRSLLATIDADMVASAARVAASIAKRAAAAPLEAALRVTPRTQTWLATRGTEPMEQLFFVVIVVAALLAVPNASMPPTLAELDATRWIELPMGLVLSLTFNDLGSKLWWLCAPVASSRSAWKRPPNDDGCVTRLGLMVGQRT